MHDIKLALISVSDKSGINDFARELHQRGVQLISTGGTARRLRQAGLPVAEISEYTGFPEIMDGRVKTLHPRIHGGLLGRRGQDDAVMDDHGIQAIDMVVVNLYPFEATIADPDSSYPAAVEQIDIGGPAMLRAAAKNHAFVTTLVDARDYARVLSAIDEGGVSDSLRRELAGKCFAHTAAYDGAIATYISARASDPERPESFPATLHLSLDKVQAMRYGENPHQAAAFYADPHAPAGTIAAARQVQGKALSYNNIADTDAALQCVQAFAGAPACVIVKHANPCGVAVAPSPLQAYRHAFATDVTSAFGGIVAFNETVDEQTVRAVLDNQFVEVIAMPGLNADAQAALRDKPNVRALVTGAWPETQPQWRDYKRVRGGLLAQDADAAPLRDKELRVVTHRQPEGAELQDLLFAWRVVKFVKSNAIVYARDARTLGVGAGQMSRVDSARIALSKARDARLDVAGAVMASDAFFPFRDGIDTAAEAGIRAVIQPGGSRRDDEVIAAADEAGIAMVFTGMRHFRH